MDMLMLLNALNLRPNQQRSPIRTWITSSIAKISEDLGYTYTDSSHHLVCSSESGMTYFTSGIAEAKDYAVSISTEPIVCGSSFCDLRIMCYQKHHSPDVVKKLLGDSAIKKYTYRDDSDIRLESLDELKELLNTLTEIAKSKPIVSAWTKTGQVAELKQKLQVKSS